MPVCPWRYAKLRLKNIGKIVSVVVSQLPCNFLNRQGGILQQVLRGSKFLLEKIGVGRNMERFFKQFGCVVRDRPMARASCEMEMEPDTALSRACRRMTASLEIAGVWGFVS